ncbi:UNVERIFIED_CONTAM: hypothetical protein HDU68_000818 [Siphonaria sp. JEL0065]|nr:hypothetical protein HDU68_000816 [Siphonaria sp. JEL0065]KAJ3013224.1 hypothetical protein HDU68_000818 [Siphonaria sp. JEL0065]
MAAAVRARTNMTAMVWAPNNGIVYPFGDSILSKPLPSDPEFAVLDTNKDGLFDSLDDPYTPYYPGDEYVDWVAVSLYYYPLGECFNCPVPSTYFHDYLTGSGPVLTRVVENPNAAYSAVHNFYAMFSGDTVHKKPLMLPETGAPYFQAWVNHDAASVSENTIKSAWWNQILNADTLRAYPKLKMVINYEDSKGSDPFQTGANILTDWKVTNTTSQLNMWIPLLNGFKSNMLEASQLVYGCDGSVKVA